MRFKAVKILVLGLFVSTLVGCAGTQQAVKTTPSGSPQPEWVEKGASAFPGDAATWYYGIGFASKSANPYAAQQKAKHRARVEISKTIKTYVASFVMDFMRDYPDYYKPELSGSEEFTQSVSKEVSEATLQGCEIMEIWTAPDGTVHALARLPKKLFDEKVTSQMRQQAGDKLQVRAEMLEEKLNAELEKLHKQEKEKLGGGAE